MGFLNDLEKEVPVQPPKGAFTAMDVEATGRYRYSQAKKVLDEKVRRGLLKTGKFKRGSHWAAHYWE